MKKILFLTPELPFPPNSGGKLKSWKFLHFLTEHYQVSVGTLLKEDDCTQVKNFLAKITINKFIFDNVRVNRNLSNLITSYIKGIPLNIFRSYSSYFAELVNQCIHDYDMVICDHYEVFQYIPKDYVGKVVAHQHNAYFLMWQRYAQSKQNLPWNRLASYLESLRVKRYEKRACNRADLIFASPNDIMSLEKIGVNKGKFRYTYHLGEDKQLDLPDLKFSQTKNSLLYVGSLNWQANIDGLLWFIEHIWPPLKLRNPDLIFNIIGKNPHFKLVKSVRNTTDIFLRGFVANLEPYFKMSRVFVAPLQYGAGMKVKVINAMYRGIPTVTTTVGSEGLDVENLKHLVITDHPEVMTNTINRLLKDDKLWKDLQKNSRHLVRQNYTWAKLFSHMNQELNLLLKKHPLEQHPISNTKHAKMV